MSRNTANDNGATPIVAPGPDAHGQAALLLVESLLHSLIARSVLSVEQAIEVVEVAADVKGEIAAERGDSPETLRRSLVMLDAIVASLKFDAPQV